MDPRPGTAGRVHYAWVILGMAAAGIMALLGFGRLSYPVVLPAMQRALGLSSAEAGLLSTFNLASFLVAAPLGGLAATRWGARRAILAGLALTGVGLLATGLASGLAAACAAQLATGVGTGLGTIPGTGLLAAWFAPSRRGRANGAMSTGTGLALVLSGAVLPWLMGADDNWRAAWLGLGAAVLAVLGLAAVLLRDDPAELGLAPLGGGTTPSPPAPPLPLRDARTTLLRSRAFWCLGAANASFGFAYIAYSTFLPAYLVNEGRMSAAEMGRMWGLMGFISAFGGLAWGAASDATGRRPAFAGVFAIFAAAFAGTALLSGPFGFYVAPLLYAATVFATPALMGAAAGDYFGPRLVFASFGLLNLFSGLGQVVSPFAAGLAGQVVGQAAASQLLAAFASLAGLAASLALPGPPRGVSARRTAPPPA